MILCVVAGWAQKTSDSVLLQVGHKKLFLLDEEGKANEMIPQCVLDFYVVGMTYSIFNL